MKNVFNYALLIILVVFSFSRGQATIGDSAIAFTLPDTSSQNFSLNDFKKDIIILNFFTTWCEPCKIEVPMLQDSIWQVYREQGVTVIGLDFRETTEELKDFINEFSVTYPMLLDTSGTIFTAYDFRGFPSNVIINRDGIIVHREEGFNIPRFIEIIDSLLSPTAIEESSLKSPIPKDITVVRAYPNPFNGSAQIEFILKQPVITTLKIFNINGQLLQTMSNSFGSGTNRINVNMANFSSGVYAYEISANGGRVTGRLVFQK